MTSHKQKHSRPFLPWSKNSLSLDTRVYALWEWIHSRCRCDVLTQFWNEKSSHFLQTHQSAPRTFFKWILKRNLFNNDWPYEISIFEHLCWENISKRWPNGLKFTTINLVIQMIFRKFAVTSNSWTIQKIVGTLTRIKYVFFMPNHNFFSKWPLEVSQPVLHKME